MEVRSVTKLDGLILPRRVCSHSAWIHVKEAVYETILAERGVQLSERTRRG